MGYHLPFSRFLNFLEISSFNLLRVRRPIIESFVPYKISQNFPVKKLSEMGDFGYFCEIFLQNLIFQILFLHQSVWLANKVKLVLNMKKYIHSNHFWLPNLTADESEYFVRIRPHHQGSTGRRPRSGLYIAPTAWRRPVSILKVPLNSLEHECTWINASALSLLLSVA